MTILDNSTCWYKYRVDNTQKHIPMYHLCCRCGWSKFKNSALCIHSQVLRPIHWQGRSHSPWGTGMEPWNSSLSAEQSSSKGFHVEGVTEFHVSFRVSNLHQICVSQTCHLTRQFILANGKSISDSPGDFFLLAASPCSWCHQPKYIL